MQKKSVGKWLLFGFITFVVILAIELSVVRIVDDRQEKNPFTLNIVQKMLDNMDVVHETADEVSYSGILGRDWTKEEENEQRELAAQSSLIMYNNIGLAEDFMLPDGNWFLDENMICLRLSMKTEDDTTYYSYFSVENEQILNTYRDYWKDAFYSYNKNTKEMVERYRYYQLVFESFYLDDKKLIPERVSIYQVENILPEGSENTSVDVTKLTLMDTMEFEVTKEDEWKHFEIVEEMDEYNITDLVYDYTCNGSGDYSVLRECTLNGKFFSLEERKQLLEDGLNETYTSKKRDLVGLSNYYYRKAVKNSQMLGGEVTAVVCEQNIFYRVYLYIWKMVLALIVADMCVAVLITVIAASVQMNKRK